MKERSSVAKSNQGSNETCSTRQERKVQNERTNDQLDDALSKPSCQRPHRLFKFRC